MAKIPDETALGERTIADGRVEHTPDRSAQILAGANQAIEGIGNAAQRYLQQDDAFNYARAQTALQSADAALEKKLAADPDWETHESRYTEEMGKARADASKLIRGARSRALFENGATTGIERGQEKIRAQSKQVEGQWGRSSLDELLETNRRAALETKDPALRAALERATNDAIVGAISKQYVTPDTGKNLSQAWSAAYGEGFVNVQPPAEQLRLLQNPKGTPADRIDPSKRADLIERLEDKMRVATDRREAKAQAALNQFETLIAAGIPSTPEMQRALRVAVTGTSVHGEFDDVMRSEAEVQTFLRKPIAEQKRIVQTKEAALMTGGGTLREARNVARLKQTFDKNVAELTNAPLLFAEKRMGEPNVPIDVMNVADPAQQPAVASTLQDRAATLHALSKDYGVRVPMRPLLPQESQELGELLERASPQQASAIFAGLRESSGTVDVFRGAMAQIAPDHPVLARAGNLAAMRRDLVTSTHWYKPDDSIASRDVAATLVRGDRILNPSKDEKGQDGAPQKKLLLPEDKSLQSRFAKEVGDAFAGRDNELDPAFQAVKAYYVGRASEKGLVAKDSTDIDNALVKEAVRATLGNVVDYNGNGRVIAPWGMSESDFEDRVERVFAVEAKLRNIPMDVTADLSAFGIVNAGGDGQYGVTLGRKLLFYDTGAPVVLDLKPPDTRDARGYIRRDKP